MIAASVVKVSNARPCECRSMVMRWTPAMMRDGAAIAAIAPSASSCVKIVLPARAHLLDSVHGFGWQCDRGFRQTQDQCVAIEVPANAYLVGSGDDWKCERGFQRIDNQCSLIAVPANAYLDDRGGEWRCERGFRKQDAGCVAVRVPRQCVHRLHEETIGRAKRASASNKARVPRGAGS